MEDPYAIGSWVNKSAACKACGQPMTACCRHIEKLRKSLDDEQKQTREEFPLVAVYRDNRKD